MTGGNDFRVPETTRQPIHRMLQEPDSGSPPALQRMMSFMDQTEVARGAVDLALPASPDLGDQIGFSNQGPGHGD